MSLSHKHTTIPWRFLLGVVMIWKAIDLIVSLVAPSVIPYLGFFSYGPTMYLYRVPNFIRVLTNFDGIFYIRIAMLRYQLTEQAYFPLYPILLFSLNQFIHNPIVSGALISHAAFILGIVLFVRYTQFLTKQENVLWALLFLLAYPTSYYFGVLYTESLFFLLVVGTLYSLKKKQYWMGMFFAWCASLTRVVGVLLLLPIGVTFVDEVIVALKRGRSLLPSILSQWRLFLVGVFSILGIGMYSLYLWATVHDPLYFIHAQESFGAHRSSSFITPAQVLYRYLKIFTTADVNFQYAIAVVEFSFYLMAAGLLCVEFIKLWRGYRRQGRFHVERLGLALFSTANIVVPSLTGTFTAVPRYTLMSLSLFLVLAEIKQSKIKIALLMLFGLLHICFFALFVQGYYVT